MLYYETIEPTTLGLLRQLQAIPLLSKTRLVGGTSLALQTGHRKSIDIDLFGEIDCEQYELVDSLSELGKLTIIKESKNIHVYQLDGVKVDIVNYKYPWIKPMVYEDDLRLADIDDIAAMKSVMYFDDAESDPMSYMIKNKSWNEIKERILKEI